MSDTKPQAIPATLSHPDARRFWLALIALGISTGISAGVLTLLLQTVQKFFWGGNGTDILAVSSHDSPIRCIAVLAGAGVIVGLGQLLLKHLSSGNSIDTTAAIWFYAGRLPTWRTLASAVLSIIGVGMGVSLGREGAPKQAGAVFANWCSDFARLTDEQRRLLVSCGSGAGMAAAYGVPLGGSLFALEVMRGTLALRYILPALFSSIIATGVAWTMLPDKPIYSVPSFPDSPWILPFAALCGLLAAPAAVLFIRLITWAERAKPQGWQRFFLPIIGLTLLGVAAVKFPQLLGNGRDVSQLVFTAEISGVLAAALLLLKPAAIVLCIRCGVPGGLFTPSLTTGAMIGASLGHLCAFAIPQLPLGLCGLLGSAAFLSATTQGPISSVVLLLELTGRDRSFILPMLLASAVATLAARSIDPRSIYDARLTDEEIHKRQMLRDKVQSGPELQA